MGTRFSVFPTRVGMNRCLGCHPFALDRIPHTRGDEPNRTSRAEIDQRVFPTRVGMNLST